MNVPTGATWQHINTITDKDCNNIFMPKKDLHKNAVIKSFLGHTGP